MISYAASRFSSLASVSTIQSFHESVEDIRTTFKNKVEDKATELKSYLGPYMTDIGESFASYANDIAQRVKRGNVFMIICHQP